MLNKGFNDKKDDGMNLNRNPTKEELQALLAACDDGDGIHVLWVERLGEVQVTLLLTETDAQWLREVDDQHVQFHYKSYAKNDGYVGKAASADALYITTLFERLLGDWQNHTRGLIDTDIKPGNLDGHFASVPGSEKTERRMRALQNKYWLEALVLANIHIENQLKSILGNQPAAKNKRPGYELLQLAKQAHTASMIDQKLFGRIKTFNTARSRVFQNFVGETITYQELETMVKASEELIVELQLFENNMP